MEKFTNLLTFFQSIIDLKQTLIKNLTDFPRSLADLGFVEQVRHGSARCAVKTKNNRVLGRPFGEGKPHGSKSRMALCLRRSLLGLLYFLGHQGRDDGEDGLGLLYRRTSIVALGFRFGGNCDVFLGLDLHGTPGPRLS